MSGVQKLDQFSTETHWYELMYFPGDQKYVINRLLKSVGVVRAEELYVGGDEGEARERFVVLRRENE